MSASDDILAERGDVRAADRHYAIFMYPNTANEDSECENGILDGLVDFADQLYDNDVIDFYAIHISYDHPDRTASDGKELHGEFKDWWEGRYDHRRGSHLCVGRGYSDGRSDGGGNGTSGFVAGRACASGVSAATDFYVNQAVHEVFHNVCDANEVSHLHEGSEHHLGYIDTDGDATPMATGYGSSVASKGGCNDNHDYTGHRTDMNYCEMIGMQNTARQDY
jgi:hypothetical protein